MTVFQYQLPSIELSTVLRSLFTKNNFTGVRLIVDFIFLEIKNNLQNLECSNYGNLVLELIVHTEHSMTWLEHISEKSRLLGHIEHQITT